MKRQIKKMKTFQKQLYERMAKFDLELHKLSKTQDEKYFDNISLQTDYLDAIIQDMITYQVSNNM